MKSAIKKPTRHNQKNGLTTLQRQKLDRQLPTIELRETKADLQTDDVFKHVGIYFWFIGALRLLRNSSLCVFNRVNKDDKEKFQVAWKNVIENFVSKCKAIKPAERYLWIQSLCQQLSNAQPFHEHTSDLFKRTFSKMDYQLKDYEGVHPRHDVSNKCMVHEPAKAKAKAANAEENLSASAKLDEEMKKWKAAQDCVECDDADIGTGPSSAVWCTHDYKRELFKYLTYQKYKSSNIIGN